MRPGMHAGRAALALLALALASGAFPEARKLATLDEIAAAGRESSLEYAKAVNAAVAAGGAITANRYDVAVALTLAAFALFLARGRTTAAAGALGVGAALKLTPSARCR